MFIDPRRAQITRRGRSVIEKSEGKKVAAKRRETRRRKQGSFCLADLHIEDANDIIISILVVFAGSLASLPK